MYSNKILICGDINSEWALFLERITCLHKSSHGPFHFLFCSGTFVKSVDDFDVAAPYIAQIPLPTYVFDPLNIFSNLEDKNEFTSINCLNGIGISTIGKLTVAYSSLDSELIGDITEIEKNCLLKAYRGCDLLLTKSLPKDLHHFLEKSEFDTLLSSGIGLGSGSSVSSKIATAVLPRYHFASSGNIYFQRSPYKNYPTNQSPAPFTRLIGLAGVSASKDKSKKWIHALSIEPIVYMSNESLSELPENVTENPYLPIGKIPKAPPTPLHSTSITAVSETTSMDHSAKRSKFNINEQDSASAANSGSFFFGAMGVPKQHHTNTTNTGDSRTLFIGNIGHSSSDRSLKALFPTALTVRRPSDKKGFAFVEFPSNREAADAMEKGGAAAAKGVAGAGIELDGRVLSIGWAKDRMEPAVTASSSSSSYKRKQSGDTPGSNLESSEGSAPGSIGPPPDPSCATLFIGNLPIAAVDKDELQSYFPGSVSVHHPVGKTFCFVEFESNERVMGFLDQLHGDELVFHGRPLRIGWASSKKTAATAAESAGGGGGGGGGASGKESSCWFCLASPDVLTHLVVSVSDYSYLALARGGIVPMHLVMVPIKCVGSRLDLSPEEVTDLKSYDASVNELFRSQALIPLRYEKTTFNPKSGKNHMHTHLIPLPAASITGLLPLFHRLAQQSNLNFEEIPEDTSLECHLTSRSAQTSEYLYMDLPTTSSSSSSDDGGKGAERKRFVYVHGSTGGGVGGGGAGSRVRFPMNFGSELAAQVIGAPERANWRHCVVPQEQEEMLAADFRAKFQDFDFTLRE